MTLFQALILAIVQGITEPFPVSSLGHAVLLPGLLHWSLDEHSPFFLPFLTMLHVGTLLALAQIFWGEWVKIIRGLLGLSGQTERHMAVQLCGRLIVATLPAIVIGGLFEHFLRSVFANPLMVSGFLILNGFLLIITSRRHHNTRPTVDHLSQITVRDALIVGCWQCLALFPGLSRSGATINGGLTRGFSSFTAARFSLLLAQPIILAATAKEAWQLRHVTVTSSMMEQGILGAIVAGITALICSRLLLRFLRYSDNNALTPFGIYCILAGLFSGIWLLF
ncbi:undecaprenyl-diphosphatase [Saccharibacter sp. 17.LH.SD]|uniref:undecaprenyl-diphosphate phosphatase n=1 Tax=Saccharibacter sp. 17.LH.SD TaxID=2689393 RepID=UPI001369B95E|nr:undecaprenyl-diphosphate phosphatase [Saccharibacter sp. 17.LH.SD]MXV44562.1 undecaprenyl-diphosphatase [Saccharibacter sp. 17.LH.SD]